MGALPNILTLARVAAVPFVVAAFFLPAPLGPWLALGLFAAAGLTDFLDGWLARRLDRVTPFGQFLDPVADKLLVAAVLVPLVADGRAPAVAALIVLGREILVSALREEMARRGERIAVSRLSKWKTAFQMAALVLLLAVGVVGDLGIAAEPLAAGGAALLWIAAALGLATAAGYARAAARAVSGGTGARR